MKEAGEAVERCLELDPYNPLAQDSQARYLIYAKKWDQAVAWINDSVKHVVAGFSPRSTRWKLTRAKARDYIIPATLDLMTTSRDRKLDASYVYRLARNFKMTQLIK